MEETVYQNIKNIIAHQYWERVSLSKRYEPKRYEVPIDSCPVNVQLRDEIISSKSNLEKNLRLKKGLATEMEGGVGHRNINFWIIQKWGGISMSDTENNQDRIVDFYNLLNQPQHHASLTAIASFSKVASFASPHEYFVYDSRVAYSINWLLRAAGATSGFFPFPQGRNKLVRHCDLPGVLCDENKHLGNTRTAYYDYCQLILRLYNDICPGEDEPYRLEMLLFQIAPIEIYEAFCAEFQGTKYFHPDGAALINNASGSHAKGKVKAKNLAVREIAPGEGRKTSLKGKAFPYEGDETFWFIGEDQKKIFCELLNSNSSYPIEIENVLSGKQFDKKGGKASYWIMDFKKDEMAAAESLYDELWGIIKETLKLEEE